MIVHIFNSSIVSGPETLVLPALKSLDRTTNVIFLSETRKGVDSDKPIEYANSLGLISHKIDVRSRVDRQAIENLRDLLIRLSPEIAHAHDVKASTYLWLAAKFIHNNRPKLFSTHHGVRGRSGWKAKFYEHFYSRLVLRHFDRILTVCGSDRNLLIKRGLPQEKVKIHLNGVDRRLVPRQDRSKISNSIRKEWGLTGIGIPSDSIILGFIGRLAQEKRIDRMLRVLDIMKRHHPILAWDLLVFGRGPLETQMIKFADKLNLSKNVHWMGYRHGVGEELAGLDILLSMSDAEGLPINIVEAGWAGTPVYSTGVDGILDLVPTPEYGTLVHLNETETMMAEKLALLIIDPDRRSLIGSIFQKHVQENFSGKRWICQLNQLYNESLRWE